jgi:hypothetical protein
MRNRAARDARSNRQNLPNLEGKTYLDLKALSLPMRRMAEKAGKWIWGFLWEANYQSSGDWRFK